MNIHYSLWSILMSNISKENKEALHLLIKSKDLEKVNQGLMWLDSLVEDEFDIYSLWNVE